MSTGAVVVFFFHCDRIPRVIAFDICNKLRNFARVFVDAPMMDCLRKKGTFYHTETKKSMIGTCMSSVKSKFSFSRSYTRERKIQSPLHL